MLSEKLSIGFNHLGAVIFPEYHKRETEKPAQSDIFISRRTETLDQWNMHL